MRNKGIHYGIECGDLREFGAKHNTEDYVLLACRRFSSILKLNSKYSQDWRKVNCKRCLHRKNK